MQIPRLGNRSVISEVQPRAELGRGSEASWSAINAGLQSVNEFIRPAVVKERVTAGERDAIEAIRTDKWSPSAGLTVRDQAFDQTSDTIITSKTMTALEEGLNATVRSANGNMKALNEGLAKIRSELGGALPQVDGLATDFEMAFTRGETAAKRQTVRIAEAARARAVRAAASEAGAAVESELELLALTGATEEEYAAALADGQARLAQFGPRGEFTLNGETYEADGKRQAVYTEKGLAAALAGLETKTRKIMVESAFLQSEAPGQFAADFRERVFAGESPFGATESLKMVLSMDSRSRTWEAQRRADAEAERKRLRETADTTVNSYVSTTEAGVPVAIPQDERDAILDALSPYPADQRAVRTEFALADAAVATHGMGRVELGQYIEVMRGGIQAAAERGELDMPAVTVVNQLEDRLSKLRDAINSEMIGLPLIEQMVADGEDYSPTTYEILREDAAGNPDVLEDIAIVESFHKGVEELETLTADQREASLEQLEEHLQRITMRGEAVGTGVAQTAEVLDRLSGWSDRQSELARTAPLAFAAARGLPVAPFTGEETLADIPAVIGARVASLGGALAGEGVYNPVPLTAKEVIAIGEMLEAATTSQQTEFLANVIDSVPEDEHVDAILTQLGATHPALAPAGRVHMNGNHMAASVIMMGANDVKLAPPETLANGMPADIQSRLDVAGPYLNALTPEAIERMDATALAYARGAAIVAREGRITEDHLIQGYEVAMGRQADGTGGPHATRYGHVILPGGWDADRLEGFVRYMEQEDIEAHAGREGSLITIMGEKLTADDMRDAMGRDSRWIMLDDKLTPVDATGAAFMFEDEDGTPTIFQIDPNLKTAEPSFVSPFSRKTKGPQRGPLLNN